MPVTGSNKEISVQVLSGGFSYRVDAGPSSGWLGAEHIFTEPRLQSRYEKVSISLFTPKVTLVPESFFSKDRASELLGDVTSLRPGDQVLSVPVPEQSSVLVYSPSGYDTISKAVSQNILTISGEPSPVLPEIWWLLGSLPLADEYNKILCSYADGWLHMVIAQGKTLCLANVFRAPDFTTAEYFIFLALKRLQLNPEVSTVYFRTPLDMDEEMSLYRYFKSVVSL